MGSSKDITLLESDAVLLGHVREDKRGEREYETEEAPLEQQEETVSLKNLQALFGDIREDDESDFFKVK